MGRSSPQYGEGGCPDFCQVLSIGLFDGISALRVAMDLLQAPMAGHIAVESNEMARRVVEANFPDSLQVNDVREVDEDMVLQWSLRYSNVGLVLIGSGPPCQGVSGLNADRRGALRDARSNLFSHVPRIAGLCKVKFPWALVKTLAENVASMDATDCQVMNEAYELRPWYIDASGLSLAHRPRLYWCDWELGEGEGVTILRGSDGRLPLEGEIILDSQVEAPAFLEPYLGGREAADLYHCQTFPGAYAETGWVAWVPRTRGSSLEARSASFPSLSIQGLAVCSTTRGVEDSQCARA